MELRQVDPRALKPNPDNPRRTKARPDEDAQLAASVRAVGVTQPPVVREDGGSKLVIVAGHRRVAAAIAAGLDAIHVLVRGPDDGSDAVRAFAENIVRTNLGVVDQWRGVEALAGEGWSEEAIATAFNFHVRTIRKLRLLARVHKPVLDRIAGGDMPREDELRAIAAAPVEEQAAAWKRLRTKRGERVAWYELVRALAKRRLLARHARFDDELAAAYGVVWEDDLFVPAGEDGRSTTCVEAFFAAQLAWLEGNLPENGTVLEVDEYGRGMLPRGAQESWRAEPGPGDLVGHCLDPRTGEVQTRIYRLPEPRPARARNAGVGSENAVPAPSRPAVTKKGVAIIGDLRTDALHQALREAPVADDQFMGMLVLALGGRNVDVRSGVQDKAFAGYGHGCARIADQLTEGGVLTRDLDTLRRAAREMLVHVLSCREGHSQSGMNARYAGAAIGADLFLPNMATQDFLKTLSKAAMERAASAERVAPRNTGKETRAALIAHVGTGTYVHPAARFAPSEAELASGCTRSHLATGCGPVAEHEDGALDGPEAAPDDGDAGEQDDAGDDEGVPPGYGAPAPHQPAA